jgi:trigger factor
MATELARLGGSRVELRVEVAPDEVGQAITRAYQRLAEKVRIPGFRPGKAPRALIDRYAGREAVIDAAFNALFPQAYLNAVKEAGVEPIDQPEVSDIVLDEGKPCTFKVQVEVMPEVKLGQYKGLPAVKAVVPVTDADVDQVLAHLRERQAELTASDQEKLAAGLFAVLDFDGFIAGQPFPGGAGREVTLELGSGRFFPGFEEALVGAARGEQREVALTFPAEYRAKHLAGKDATFKVTVKEIKEKRLPALDDEFAKAVSDFATLEELKAGIGRQVAEEREKEQRQAVENQLIAAATEKAEVEVPEQLIQQRSEAKLREMAERLRSGGYTLADYLGENRTEEDLRRDLRRVAEEELKSRLVVEAIGKAERLQATEEEVEAKLQALAGGDADKAAQLRKRLEQENRLEDFVARLTAEKAVNLLVATAEINEEVTPTEPEKDKGKGDEA